jgi:hypothetical protein
VADAVAAFDPHRFWPAHPLDDGLPDGHTSLYAGAVGVIWALDYLARAGATRARIDSGRCSRICSLHSARSFPSATTARTARCTSATWG